MAESSLSNFVLEDEVRSSARSSMGCMSILAIGGTLLLVPNLGELLTDLRTGEWGAVIGFLVVIGLTLLFGAIGYSSYGDMKDPRRTSIYTKIARLGPVDEVVAELEKQIRESGHLIGSFIFTPNYLFDKSKLELYQYSELLWIYKKQTRHSVNFIPTGSTYEVIMHMRDGKQHSMSGAAKVVDQVLAILANGCPWIIAGYSDKLLALWNKSPQQFAEAVDARMQSVQDEDAEE